MGTLDRQAYLRHRYGGSQRLVHWRELSLIRRLTAGLELERVVDAPSGHGRLLEVLTGARVTCVDSDRRHLLALVEAEGQGSADVLQADLLSPWPLADESFDLALCFRFLQHVREPDAQRFVLSELARVSRRWVLASYYGRRSLHQLQRATQRRLGRRRRALAFVRRRDFSELAREAGLSVREDLPVLPGLHAQRVALLERSTTRTV